MTVTPVALVFLAMIALGVALLYLQMNGIRWPRLRGPLHRGAQAALVVHVGVALAAFALFAASAART